jgi:hypothetical protein
MKSQLGLQIIEDRNCQVLTIKDISVYNENITNTCNELLITPPGLGETFKFEVSDNFLNTYNSHSFKYTSTSCEDELIDLADGIYQIRYQVCPTDKVYVEYHYLRQCQALNMYYEALCALKLDPRYPSSFQKEKMEELRDIKQYLDAAKSYVESCGAPRKGLELHNYALEKLKDLGVVCKTCL